MIKMFKTGEKSHLFQNCETFFCSNLYRSVIISNNKLTAITKNTPTNYVAEILQQQHINQPRMLPHVKVYLPKRSQYGKRASQSSTTTSGKFE